MVIFQSFILEILQKYMRYVSEIQICQFYTP